MHKGIISSGIDRLDGLIDSFHIGDNVIWEVDAGTSHYYFVNMFLVRSANEGRNTIYISFNHSPQSILSRYGKVAGERFLLIDCFTSGKGKDDYTFSKYYDGEVPSNVIRINRPADIDHFTQRLNEIEDGFPGGACYVFDSLTGMQDLWGSEEKTYKFFTYMCPRLYDLETVAYWLMEKDAHSTNFKANLRHITQVVLELIKKSDNLFLKAVKLEGRQDREAFKARQYRIQGENVVILSGHHEAVSDIDIGTKIRKLRAMKDMSQKELADKVGLTPSSISQLENNQISPTMNNFLLICKALNVSPAEFWAESKEPSWIVRGPSMHGLEKADVFSLGKVSGHLRTIELGATYRDRHAGGRVGYVLKGNVEVGMNKETYHLFEGDAAIARKGQTSVWKNIGTQRALMLFIET